MPNPKWAGTSVALYTEIQAKMTAGRDPRTDEITHLMGELGAAVLTYLESLTRAPLTTALPGKAYFAFESATGKISRAVNRNLFGTQALVAEFIAAVQSKEINGKLTSLEITAACYTLVMGLACVVDLSNAGDRQTPGTFFQYLITHLLTRTLNVAPSDKIRLKIGQNDTSEVILTMDLLLDRGVGKRKYHIAIKNSTRERASEFWAHQRILDKAFASEPYVGIFVGLAETKLDHTARKVTEICVPDQWRAYQAYISKISRIYYLDPPNAYLQLNTKQPPIIVKPFGDYFFDDWDVLDATSETPESTNDSSVRVTVEEFD